MAHIGVFVPASLVTAVVFSRDRAPQVDTLLTSLQTHCTDPFYLDVRVLFSASSDEVARRYRLVERQWRDVLPITFEPQIDFRHDLLAMLGLPDRSSPRGDLPAACAFRRLARRRNRLERMPVGWRHLLLLTDEHIFVHRFSLAGIAETAWQKTGMLGLSLDGGTAPGAATLGAAAGAGAQLGALGCLYTSRVIAPLLAGLSYSCSDTLATAIGAAGERFRMHPEWPRMLGAEPGILLRQTVDPPPRV